MGHLADVGEADGWRCWLCDEPVDRNMPPNDPRSASIDKRITKAKAKKKKQAKTDLPPDRLAHKGCNTNKGASDPVITWPEHLIVVEPACLIAAAERLERSGKNGGREAVARCPAQEDADAVATWLIDRLSRLSPTLEVNSQIKSAGGQYLVSLTTA